MKAILRGYGIRMTTEQRQIARSQASDTTLTRGTAQVPQPPRDPIAQSGPRGLLVTWNLPAGFNSDIQRWRVYKDDEATLYQEINDRGTRQCFVETTAGSTPPVTNIFVSSLNSLGIESRKVHTQGKATVEAGAPPMPSVPPGYNNTASGGGNTGTNYNQGPGRGKVGL
jgi:hypothetical protein